MDLAKTVCPFRPPGADTGESTQGAPSGFDERSLSAKALDAVSDIVLIVDCHRKIVVANQALHRFSKIADVEEIIGQRPGDVFGCAYAAKAPKGCGTTEQCRTCGANMSLRDALGGTGNEKECRINRKSGLGALDLRVKSTPIEADGESFVMFVLSDIGHEKRRQALERIFFHDILNLAGNVQGLFDVLMLDHHELKGDFATRIGKNIDLLVAEINAHKELTAAENNELTMSPEPVEAAELWSELVDLIQFHRAAWQRQILVDARPPRPIRLVIDRRLLSRVLWNLLKNALEASASGETVTVGADEKDDFVQFWVHNSQVMPKDVQRQLFHRSFSTKGNGRGLGTYSVKLLNERYLGGTIRFSSTPENGTVFTASYRKNPAEASFRPLAAAVS